MSASAPRSARPAPTPPSSEVLRAFGATAPLEFLSGGRGLTWRSGPLVLRPAEGDGETIWKSEMLASLGPDERFAVPKPIATGDGAWVCAGWQAMAWMPGHADERRLDDVVRAGRAFQEVLSEVARPVFIDESDDAWSVADRIAWGEHTPPTDPFLRALIDEYRGVAARSQVVHGDLLGNVLFADGHPPTIIDWAPYWRPAGFGPAVAVVDAVCWHGASPATLAGDRGFADWRDLLLRALVFRIATLHRLGLWDEAGVVRHAPIAEAVIRLD
ncbi:hypothetical protein [Microbacterium sp.]|uniref:hypothetical protein n=1 Tax=Microbacterium sp. TaxID=51671 RepID=UPI003342C8D8